LLVQTLLATVQWPAFPQSALVVQAVPVEVHAPDTPGQSALVVHPPPRRLQLPIGPHGVLSKQPTPERLHVPGWVGHSAFVVQTAPVTVQAPTNVGGGQLVTRWHSIPSGRGLRPQLGSFQSVVQVEGSGSTR